MKNPTHIIWTLRVLTLATAWVGLPEAHAQTVQEFVPTAAEPAEVIRFGMGFGAGVMGADEAAIAGRVGLTFSRPNDRIITVRSAAVSEFVIFGPSPAEEVWDVAVLYGKESRSQWGYVSAAAGVALVGGMRRGERISDPYQCTASGGLSWLGCGFGALFTPVEYAEEPFYTVGIPVEVEAGFTFSKVLGIGLSAFANFNGERSVTGASFSVILGRLR